MCSCTRCLCPLIISVTSTALSNLLLGLCSHAILTVRIADTTNWGRRLKNWKNCDEKLVILFHVKISKAYLIL
jgi:hypothetical protein